MKNLLIFALLFFIVSSCQKQADSIASSTPTVNNTWTFVSSTAFAFSPTQTLGPLRVTYTANDLITISSDTLWKLNAHSPNFGYTINNNVISNFTSGLSSNISIQNFTVKKLNDTTYINGVDTLFIRNMTATSLVLYNRSHDIGSKTGLIEVDSLKK